MKLKQVLVALAALATVIAVEADGATLSVDRVKQRYPWNGLVDIDYTISVDDNVTFGPDDNLEVLMVDKSVTPAVTNRAVRFQQVPLPMTAGRHRITWLANDDGVTTCTDNAEFHVKVVHYAEAYMVIDVSRGSNETTYPVDFVTGVPASYFNTEEYKTGKIVLRRIHQGSYVAGSPKNEAYRAKASGDETQHYVTLTKPFYIGIFEITAKQYQNVMGAYPGTNLGDTYPAGAVPWNTVKDNFVTKLSNKCKSKASGSGDYAVAVTGFDLPTEAQWEYACRAGTTKAFNGSDDFDNTKTDELDKQISLLGRYKGNAKGEHNPDLAIVGSYLPNAWGLYDMHGNAWELCRDWWGATQAGTVATEWQHLVDPTGPSSAGWGSYKVKRGGCCVSLTEACRSAYRSTAPTATAGGDYGFRIILPLP